MVQMKLIQISTLLKVGRCTVQRKVIDEMAERFVVIADENKIVDYLGQTFVLPVEVDKFNWYQVSKRLRVLRA